jgi:hypothetical protein
VSRWYWTFLFAIGLMSIFAVVGFVAYQVYKCWLVKQEEKKLQEEAANAKIDNQNAAVNPERRTHVKSEEFVAGDEDEKAVLVKEKDDKNYGAQKERVGFVDDTNASIDRGRKFDKGNSHGINEGG